MHTVAIAPNSRVFLGTQVVVAKQPWLPPRIRLHLRTDADCGVILDFGNTDNLRFLISALQTLLDNCHDAEQINHRASLPPGLNDGSLIRRGFSHR